MVIPATSDHQPHRHPHPGLVLGGIICRHTGHFRRKAGFGPQRSCPAQLCWVCATLSAPERNPQCSLSGAGGAGPTGEPAGAGCQRGLFRLFVRHCGGAGPAGYAGRAVRAGHRERGPFPPDGSRRPLHLRTVWRWCRCGHVWLADTPFALTLGARAAMSSMPAGRTAQVPHPSPWTARQCSALRWMPCPTACTRCWTRPARRWTIWTGWSAIRPTAASSTTASGAARRPGQVLQEHGPPRQHQRRQHPGSPERAGESGQLHRGQPLPASALAAA